MHPNTYINSHTHKPNAYSTPSAKSNKRTIPPDNKLQAKQDTHLMRILGKLSPKNQIPPPFIDSQLLSEFNFSEMDENKQYISPPMVFQISGNKRNIKLAKSNSFQLMSSQNSTNIPSIRIDPSKQDEKYLDLTKLKGESAIVSSSSSPKEGSDDLGYGKSYTTCNSPNPNATRNSKITITVEEPTIKVRAMPQLPISAKMKVVKAPLNNYKECKTSKINKDNLFTFSDALNTKAGITRKRSSSQTSELLLDKKLITTLLNENKLLKEKLEGMRAHLQHASEEASCLRRQMNYIISLSVK
jgi:hypothetical protein